jgi:hypothetical protein
VGTWGGWLSCLLIATRRVCRRCYAVEGDPVGLDQRRPSSWAWPGRRRRRWDGSPRAERCASVCGAPATRWKSRPNRVTNGSQSSVAMPRREKMRVSSAEMLLLGPRMICRPVQSTAAIAQIPGQFPRREPTATPCVSNSARRKRHAPCEPRLSASARTLGFRA